MQQQDTGTVSAAAMHVPPLGLWTKLAYGFGAVANGVKDQGYNYFLMFFYSGVVGLDARLAGLAIFIALVIDAISDPLVGYISDHVRSRWGRRHPFMYASALPMALAYFFVWTPPDGLSQGALFAYLLVMAILTRTFITLYTVPSSALVPELSESYDARTDMMSYRYFFGWFGGASLSIIALAFLLVPTETIENGYFNTEGYRAYGYLAAILIFASIILSSWGTHHRIAYLKAAPPPADRTIGKIFREIVETLSNRSFLALFVAALFSSAATGIGAGLNHYLMGFFWEFTPGAVSQIQLGLFISCGVALAMSQIISRQIGKKKGALITGSAAMILTPLPYALRLIDLMPANGDPALFYLIFLFTLIDVALIITAQILISSMIADIVEQSEIKTGRRSEGLFFSAVSFSRKCTLGLGGIVVATILSLALFPEGAKPGEVSAESVRALGVYYVPIIFAVWLLMLSCVSLYTIDRDTHEANLTQLKNRQSSAST